MKVLIHRGTNQIGGSVLEVESKGTRLLLDAGLPLEPTPASEHIPMTLDTSGINGILLSHAHPDHYGIINELPEKIPVYLTQGTNKAMMAAQLFAGGSSIPRNRQRTISPGEELEIGSFKIIPHSVDHSAFDGVAYSLFAEGKHILYTGDLRAHGRKPGMLKALVRFCKVERVDILVTEGTRIPDNNYNPTSEYEVEQKIENIEEYSEKLILAWFSPLNIDRWVSIFKATRNRIFVHDLYTEFVHHLVKSQIRFLPLARECDRIHVYCPKYQRRHLKNQKISKILGAKKPLKSAQEAINPQDERIMLFRPSMLDSDFNGSFPSGTELIVSVWSGYTKSPEFKKVEEAIDQCDGKIHNIHSSGHIYRDDLINFIHEINPQMIIPVHTEQPEEFLKVFPQTSLAVNGEPVSI